MRSTRRAVKARRFNYSMCHEVAHYLLSEQEKRIELGLPHTDWSDIMNGWLLESGQRHGHPPPGSHPLNVTGGPVKDKLVKDKPVKDKDKSASASGGDGGDDG